MRKPWLWLPPQLAHDLSPLALSLRGKLFSPAKYTWQPRTWRGLQFANPLGLAGGVDKNATEVRGWWTYGPGFLEIGTVTPEPQAPNPGKIIDRDLEAHALWNKMGFPSAGSQAVFRNLNEIYVSRQSPIFVNMGKNRTTGNENAAKDYIAVFRKLAPVADGFVVNVSSPNTQGLRALQSSQALRDLLAALKTEARSSPASAQKPLLLKLSPDLSDADLDEALEVSLEVGIDGWILSNSTLTREAHSRFPKEGGVSGRPVAPLAKSALQKTVALLGSERGDKLLISVGGVLTPDDVQERLEMGADLVQVYSALVFEGPGFFKKVAKNISAGAQMV
jgi:dihydroorotate dehydrogenase